MEAINAANTENWSCLLEISNKLVAKYPKDITSYRWHMTANISLGRFETALKSCDKVLELDLADSTAWQIKSVCYLNFANDNSNSEEKRTLLAKALENIEKAIDIEPDEKDYQEFKEKLVSLASMITIDSDEMEDSFTGLEKCRHCKEKVSIEVKTCPQCGSEYPTPTRFQKHEKLGGLVIIFGIIGFICCGFIPPPGLGIGILAFVIMSIIASMDK